MKHKDVETIVARELDMQRALANKPQVLNIPCVLGPVGVGKTAMARTMAEKFQMPLVCINVGENSDPTDVSGIPVPTIAETAKEFHNPNARYVDWVLNKIAALAVDQPVFLFIDDIDKGEGHVLTALLSLFGNRMFRDQKLHPLTLIMCAGNRVGDDIQANQLSESIVTRVTVLELDPDPVHFCTWGAESGEIHPNVVGYLAYKPDQLHSVGKSAANPGAQRDATPRGWWEASQQMFHYPIPDERIGDSPNWKGIIARKCGPATAHDFWAWYEVLSSIDLDAMLATRTLVGMPMSDVDGQRRRWQFGLVFKLASYLLQNRIKEKDAPGLEHILEHGLTPELSIALAVQIPTPVRARIADMSDIAAALMARAILPPIQK